MWLLPMEGGFATTLVENPEIKFLVGEAYEY